MSQVDLRTSFLRAVRTGNVSRVVKYIENGIDINEGNTNGLNALHLASKEGHLEVVRELLRCGARVDQITRKGNTALHIASLGGQLLVVQELIRSGANVNQQSQNGFTPLYMAAQENHEQIVQTLLTNGAIQSISTEDGFTPLAVALQQGHNQVVSLLLANDSREKNRMPAIHIAVRKDDIKSVQLLIQADTNINKQTEHGFTPLHVAAHYGSEQTARLLIEKNADVNFQAKNNITPLHVASKLGRCNVIKVLVDNEALVDAQNRDGLTALHCAARSGHTDAVKLLLECGADFTVKTKNGLTALHMAAQGDHVQCSDLLVQRGSNIDEATLDLLTPLHVAAHCGMVTTVRYLLTNKCQVNSRALNGFTPLHVAVKKLRIRVVELLLRCGAEVNVATETGLSPLHIAAFLGSVEIVRVLLSSQANIHQTNTRLETPLHLASRNRQLEIMQLLLNAHAEVNCRAQDDVTALHMSARIGHLDGVLLLLNKGADVKALTKDGNTPLHLAAREGKEDVVEVLIDHKADIHAKNSRGFTPLSVACRNGRLNVARRLIDLAGTVDTVNDVSDVNGLSPLHVAVHFDHCNVVELLLDRGAQVQARTTNGSTALHIAAKRGLLDIVSLLLMHVLESSRDTGGRAVDSRELLQSVVAAQTDNGRTPLHLAAQEGHTDIVSLLLSHGAAVDAQSKSGLRPLHLAAQEDRVAVAEILLANQAELVAASQSRFTPLHSAAHFGRARMVRLLLDRRHPVDVQTASGFTPLHLAAQEGHTAVVQVLLDEGADPNITNKQGWTAAHVALAQRHGEIYQQLRCITTVIESWETEELEIVDRVWDREPVEDLLEDEAHLGADPYDDKLSRNTTLLEPVKKGASDAGRIDSVFLGRPESSNYDSQGYLNNNDIIQELEYLPKQDTSTAMLTQSDSEAGNLDSMQPGHTFSNKSKYLASTSDDETCKQDQYQSGFDQHPVGPGVLEGPQDSPYFSKGGDSSMMFRTHLDETPPSFEEHGDPESKLLVDGTVEEHLVARPISQSLQSKQAPTVDSRQQKRSLEEKTVLPMDLLSLESQWGFESHNVQIIRNPVNSGFLVSFLVDAQGGVLRSRRFNDLRILVPPNTLNGPTRIICRLVKPQRLIAPLALNDGNGFACRVLEMGPRQARFANPVLIEVPFYASLRGIERELVVFRSDNGETWKEHTCQCVDADLQHTFAAMFDNQSMASNAEMLEQRRVVRILTNDIPVYFAVISRLRQDAKLIGPEGDFISSSTVPEVQAVFPKDSLTKNIKVALQAQTLDPGLCSRIVDQLLSRKSVVSCSAAQIEFSPVVSIEPRRRKFHKPITLTIPIPNLRGLVDNQSVLRLLCSITGSNQPAHWEDITDSSPLMRTKAGLISFSTTVSARFWLAHCASNEILAHLNLLGAAREIYDESNRVPYFGSLAVFGRRGGEGLSANQEGELRATLLIDDHLEEKTLERLQDFQLVALGPHVEVLHDQPHHLELMDSTGQLSDHRFPLPVRAFHENRSPPISVAAEHSKLVLWSADRSVRFVDAAGSVRSSQAPLVVLDVKLPPVNSQKIYGDEEQLVVPLTDDKPRSMDPASNQKTEAVDQASKVDAYLNLINTLDVAAAIPNVTKDPIPDAKDIEEEMITPQTRKDPNQSRQAFRGPIDEIQSDRRAEIQQPN